MLLEKHGSSAVIAATAEYEASFKKKISKRVVWMVGLAGGGSLAPENGSKGSGCGGN